MGSVELGRRWTVRVCGALVLLVVLLCATVVRDRKTQQRRGKDQLSAVLGHHNVSLDQSLVVTRVALVAQSKVATMNENDVTESLSRSTTENKVLVNPTIESALPSTHEERSPELRPAPKLQAKFIPLKSSEINGLRLFVLFVGFARSGHSIIGSLLDAHPDVIIAHEYNILKDVRKGSGNTKGAVLSLVNKLYKNSHDSAASGWRSEKKGEKGYTLDMTGGWQGRIRRLKVVGDKAAGKIVKEHMHDTSRCPDIMKMMNATLGVTVKAIRVLRNPYDIISTRVLYNTVTMNEIASARNPSSQTVKYKQPALLARQIECFFELTSQVNKTITECNLPVQDVHLADLVHRPRSVMKELCEAVQVECYSEYLDLCEQKVFKTLSKTRYLVEWSQPQIETVAQRIRAYPEFSRYSYDCNC